MTVTRSSAASGRPTAPPSGWRRQLRRPGVAALVLLAAYALASLGMDPHGSLGTDTGGKVATLEVMVDTGSWVDPDVGWWAADADPDAELHGLYFTSRIGDRYVNVTTLPMIIAARPLYALGGYRLALLLPMAGAVLAAFAARAIAERVASESASRRAPADVGWWAFWLVGAASPMAVYALDLWEHSLGVAAMSWGVVALLHVLDRPRWTLAALAGLAFGAAFAVRTEALAYAVVAVGAACIALLLARRRLTTVVGIGAAAVGGFVVPTVANALLEVAVLGTTFRADRSAGAAAAGGDDLALRSKEALITSVSLLRDPDLALLGLQAAVVLALAYAAWRAVGRGAPGPAVLAAVAGAGLYLWRVAEGPGFVRGLFVAAPLAIVGVALAWRSGPTARLVAAVALAALPLVWLFQYSGGALPQWGGRYTLTSAVLLTAVGVGASPALAPWARRLFVGLAVCVTALGLVWLGQRSHAVGEAAAAVAARPEPVVVSDVEFWLRELGAAYPGTHWMTATDDDLVRAADIAAADGAESLALLQLDEEEPPPARLGPYERGATDRATWIGAPFRITRYVLAGPP